jgi:hypothetical protein
LTVFTLIYPVCSMNIILFQAMHKARKKCIFVRKI